MRNLNTKPAIGIVAAIVCIVALFHSKRGEDLSSPITLFKIIIPQSISATFIAWTIFSKWFWRWKYWRPWLVTVPNFNGTWTGQLYSNWENPATQERPGPIPVQLSIFQTLISIRCTLITRESISTSFAEEFLIDPADPTSIQLVYSYKNTPDERLRNRSHAHAGTCILRYSESCGRKLEGSYWTNRIPTPNTGRIDLIFSSSEIMDALPPEFGKHPVSEL